MNTKISEKQRTLIFINIIISCIATTMMSTALTTALPAIVHDLSISVNTGQWLTSGYSLAMGIMMPLTAFLITRFPTKKLYISAIILFILGLGICSIAPNFLTMMIGRILQASGNGILSSMAQVILLTIYPMEKHGEVMGWYGLSIGAAPVIAPTIAGMLVDSSGWRMIFYASISIMLLSLLFAIGVFSNVLEVRKQSFDVVSFVISAFAFGGITLGIGNIGAYSFTNSQVLFPLLLGALAALLFVYRQLKLKQPFLDVRVAKNREFRISLISSMLLYVVMMGSSILMPLYVQSIMGYSATISGLVTLPGSLAMTIVSPFAGRIYDRFGMKKLFITGAAFLLFSNVGMFLLTMSMPIWIAALYNVMRCLAIGCLMMPLVTWGMSGIKQQKMAHGTALLTSLRTIAGAIGSAIFVSVMTVTAAHSQVTYGGNAQLHGLNIAFFGMSLCTFLLLIIAFFSVKKNTKKPEPLDTIVEIN
ncbi:MAG: MDR family MFS transporter [Enterococcus sp.]